MAWQSTYPSLSATQGRIKAFVLECYLCPTQVFFRTKTFLRKKKFSSEAQRERTDGKRKALLYDHIQSSWTAHKVSPTGLEDLLFVLETNRLNREWLFCWIDGKSSLIDCVWISWGISPQILPKVISQKAPRCTVGQFVAKTVIPGFTLRNQNYSASK